MRAMYANAARATGTRVLCVRDADRPRRRSTPTAYSRNAQTRTVSGRQEIAMGVQQSRLRVSSPSLETPHGLHLILAALGLFHG